ncbi:MAG: polyprenyl synthetase family protein [Treponema sp.]|jgi:octaprenyl-diphosphate synthase|nr:polyprenyl synthetase family protein [Treponema sp.]
MNKEYSLRLGKIEEQLRKSLPAPSGETASWAVRVFPGLETELSPEAARFLTEPGAELLSRGGKRWRPLLMTLVCEALGGGDAALPLAPLVEFPHNASLVHDDIEDNSDMRRGKPAVHILYGVDTAINGGSFLYFLPLSHIESWDAPADLKNLVYAVWGAHIRRLHLGQAMDIRWHRDFSSLPSLEAYRLMCRLKTGALARLAAMLGVYAARQAAHTAAHTRKEQESQTKNLAEYLGGAAERLGVGFQILDDVVNLRTGNPGKKRGDDIVEGKKSLPILLYLHRRQDRRGWVEACFTAARANGSGADEVEALIGELEGAGILEEARNQGLALIREARDVFAGDLLDSPFPADTEARKLLAGLVELIS